MNIIIFFFEVSDKIPTIIQFYISGILFGLTILIATFFNRWLGLGILIFALWWSTLSMSDALGADILEAVIKEMGRNYEKHWNYSMYFGVALEITAFIMGLFSRIYILKKDWNGN